MFFRICFQKSVELIELKFDSPLPDSAGSQISPQHYAAGSQIFPLHDAAASQILPLHDAAGSQILPPHDAAGSPPNSLTRRYQCCLNSCVRLYGNGILRSVNIQNMNVLFRPFILCLQWRPVEAQFLVFCELRRFHQRFFCLSIVLEPCVLATVPSPTYIMDSSISRLPFLHVTNLHTGTSFTY